MKINLIYNPGAGSGDFEEDTHIKSLEEAGYRVNPISTEDENFKKILKKLNKFDAIVVAGGDGTIGKVLKNLPKTEAPIGILPAGTANNIAASFEINGNIESLITSWRPSRLKKISMGVAKGAWGKKKFIESVGFGIFTNLIKVTEKKSKEVDIKEPSAKVDFALATLKNSVESYKASYCKIEIDGEDYSGEYLLVEIMNISYVGPNLFLAPAADPGDDVLDVVFIKENERALLQDYLTNKLQRQETMMPLTRIKGRSVKIRCMLSEVHIDDRVIDSDKEDTIKIYLNDYQLNFF